MTDYPIVEQTRVIQGIMLHWEVIRVRYDATLNKATDVSEGWRDTFVPLSTMRELAEVDYWQSDFGQPYLIPGVWEDGALVYHGFAETRTRGSHVPTEKLKKFLEELDRE
jgi:hypothetical protein